MSVLSDVPTVITYLVHSFQEAKAKLKLLVAKLLVAKQFSVFTASIILLLSITGLLNNKIVHCSEKEYDDKPNIDL